MQFSPQDVKSYHVQNTSPITYNMHWIYFMICVCNIFATFLSKDRKVSKFIGAKIRNETTVFKTGMSDLSHEFITWCLLNDIVNLTFARDTTRTKRHEIQQGLLPLTMQFSQIYCTSNTIHGKIKMQINNITEIQKL